MAGIVVRPRAGILRGHDWVYASEVLKTFGSPADGDVVSVKDGRDRMLGSAIYNSRSQIVARRFSRRKQALDAEFFERRIRLAADWRDRAGCPERLRRVVWSESDGLPGVIADRYGDTVVLQTVTLAMDARKAQIAECLVRALGADGVIERNDSSIRAAEGLEPATGVLCGSPRPVQEIEVAGARFEVDLAGGQKTGFYLDQAANYAEVARHAAGRRVLDCFANQGGFAIACAVAGASEVEAVESGADAVARLESNARLNGVAVRAARADVFDFLKARATSPGAYDLVVLDPPSFTRARSRVADALRGYRDLHMRAAALLEPGALVATFSCSHHVSDAAFFESVRDGFFDARRTARVVGEFRQAPDHPWVAHLPETAYLKGYLLELMPGR